MYNEYFLSKQVSWIWANNKLPSQPSLYTISLLPLRMGENHAVFDHTIFHWAWFTEEGQYNFCQEQDLCKNIFVCVWPAVAEHTYLEATVMIDY